MAHGRCKHCGKRWNLDKSTPRTDDGEFCCAHCFTILSDIRPNVKPTAAQRYAGIRKPDNSILIGTRYAALLDE